MPCVFGPWFSVSCSLSMTASRPSAQPSATSAAKLRSWSSTGAQFPGASLSSRWISSSNSTSSRSRSRSSRGSGGMLSGSRHNPNDSAGPVATPQPSRSFRASPAAVESGPVVVAVSISTRSCDGSFTERSAVRTVRLTPFSLRASTSRASVVRWSSLRSRGSSCSTANFTTTGSEFGRAARNRSRCFVSRGVRPRPAIWSRANCCEGRLSPRSNTWRRASSRASSSVGSVTRRSATASWIRAWTWGR